MHHVGEFHGHKWITRDELHAEHQACINQVARFYLAMQCLIFFIVTNLNGQYDPLYVTIGHGIAIVVTLAANRYAIKLTYQQAIHNLTKED